MLCVSIHCDFCGRVLPTEQRQTKLGTVTIVKTGKTKVWDTSGMGRHLCTECALRIDNELLKFKLELLGKGN